MLSFRPAKWEFQLCVNDGKQAEWEKAEDLFRFKEECCAYKFESKFDDCMGPPTLEPTKEPTLKPYVVSYFAFYDSRTHVLMRLLICDLMMPTVLHPQSARKH
jgi:hypothetical protein